MEELREVEAVARLKELALVRRWLTRVTHLLEMVTEKRDASERASVERHFAVAQNRKREAARLLMELQRDEALATLIETSTLTWLGATSMEEAFDRISQVRMHLVVAYDLYEIWQTLQVRYAEPTPEQQDLLNQAAIAFDRQSMATSRSLPDSLEVLLV